MRKANRGVSTVVDVSVALLLVSASVLLIGFALAGPSEPIAGDRADRVAQGMSGSTVSVTYDLREPNDDGIAATESEQFERPEDLGPDHTDSVYELTTYGSASGLLADAALTDVRFDDERLFDYGGPYGENVDYAIRERFVGLDHDIYVAGGWRPFDGSSLEGTATVGAPPPASEDVSSVSQTVSSDVPPVDEREMAVRFERAQPTAVGTPVPENASTDGFDGAAPLLAEAVVAGYFPVEESQYALESSGTERSVTVYNYRQLAAIVDVEIDEEITGTAPDAAAANERLVGEAGEDGLADWLAADMRESELGTDLTRTWNESDEESVTDDLEELFEVGVTPETVDVTVQVWDP